MSDDLTISELKAAFEIIKECRRTRHAKDLWCVCWLNILDGEDNQHGKGPPVPRAEADRRMAWGRETYPHVFYWLERP